MKLTAGPLDHREGGVALARGGAKWAMKYDGTNACSPK